MRALPLIFLLVASVASARIVVHGHRGSRGTRPENTLPAFAEGLAAGADYLELDLHVTGDGVLVVSHDADISPRLCRENGASLSFSIPLRSLKAADLARFDCGAIMNPEFPRQVPQPNTTMPTFEAVLEWVDYNAPNIQLNVETKMDQGVQDPDPQAFVEAILIALERHRLLDRSVLQSFDFRTLKAARRLRPAWRTSALFNWTSKFCAETQQAGANYASPSYRSVSAREVAECHRRGIQVHPWTVNDAASWKTLLGYGVDGIITDYPRDLVGFLTTRQLRD